MKNSIVKSYQEKHRASDHEKELREANIKVMIEIYGEDFINSYAAGNLRKLYAEAK